MKDAQNVQFSPPSIYAVLVRRSDAETEYFEGNIAFKFTQLSIAVRVRQCCFLSRLAFL